MLFGCYAGAALLTLIMGISIQAGTKNWVLIAVVVFWCVPPFLLLHTGAVTSKRILLGVVPCLVMLAAGLASWAWAFPSQCWKRPSARCL